MSDRPATLAVHTPPLDVGQSPLNTPIYQSSTFLMDDAVLAAMDTGVVRDAFLYSRYGNPTLEALQRKLAALEHTESALVTSSGMAAITTAMLTLVHPGSTLVAPDQLYGGTWAFFDGFLRAWGVDVRFVDLDDAAAVDAALTDAIDPVLYLEPLTNPLLNVPPLHDAIARAHAHEATVVVDNTFLGPVWFRPAEHGADVVIESCTKYLSGHHDVTGGMIAGSRAQTDKIWKTLILLGGCLDPHAAMLVDRGVKTLALRCEAHQRNARAVADALADHPAVAQVIYPGRPDHPHHARTGDWDGHGGMVTFVLRGGDGAADALLPRFRVFRSAASLGGVESLVSLPRLTSNRDPAQRARIGLQDGTVRLSVGCEDVTDLLADLHQGLDGAR